MNSTAGRRARAAVADLEDVWRSHRGYLVDLAARVTRDRAAAEDIVQEAFTRFSHIDRAAIDDARAWLAVVVRRLALDRIRSAHSRRETVAASGAWAVMGPSLGGEPGAQDPVDRITLDDQVRMALAVVLDRLTPAERTSFVLHDVFEIPFEAVSEIVGRSPAACRQLASRARRAVKAEQPSGPGDAPVDERDVLAERFVAACSTGDLDSLLAVLDPDVVGEGGMVGGEPLARFVGRDDVARRTLGYLGPREERAIVPLPFDEMLYFVAIESDQVVAVVRARVSTDGLVDDLHAVVMGRS